VGGLVGWCLCLCWYVGLKVWVWVVGVDVKVWVWVKMQLRVRVWVWVCVQKGEHTHGNVPVASVFAQLFVSERARGELDDPTCKVGVLGFALLFCASRFDGYVNGWPAPYIYIYTHTVYDHIFVGFARTIHI